MIFKLFLPCKLIFDIRYYVLKQIDLSFKLNYAFTSMIFKLFLKLIIDLVNDNCNAAYIKTQATISLR